MFTGIVAALGRIERVNKVEKGLRLEVSDETLFDEVTLGESIAVNGVCLTVVAHENNRVSFDLSAETLERTSLGGLTEGSRVNLERPLTLSTLLGGHLVQGHVDGKGTLASVSAVGEGYAVRFEYPVQLKKYIVEKGSITVDGISLTVAALADNWFEIAVIPHTWKVTNLSSLKIGSDVNLEVDVIAKYVERLMAG